MFKYQKLIEEWFACSLRPNSRGEVKIICFNPKHNDKKPSLSINLETGLWHCFGCSMSGNIYQLAKLLGKTLNLSKGGDKMQNHEVVPEGNEVENVNVNNIDITEERKRLRHKILAEAVNYYHKNFLDAGGESPVASFLIERGLTKETAKQYKIGYAQKDGLMQHLISKGFEIDDCI